MRLDSGDPKPHVLLSDVICLIPHLFPEISISVVGTKALNFSCVEGLHHYMLIRVDLSKPNQRRQGEKKCTDLGPLSSLTAPPAGLACSLPRHATESHLHHCPSTPSIEFFVKKKNVGYGFISLESSDNQYPACFQVTSLPTELTPGN